MFPDKLQFISHNTISMTKIIPSAHDTILILILTWSLVCHYEKSLRQYDIINTISDIIAICIAVCIYRCVEAY